MLFICTYVLILLWLVQKITAIHASVTTSYPDAHTLGAVIFHNGSILCCSVYLVASDLTSLRSFYLCR